LEGDATQEEKRENEKPQSGEASCYDMRILRSKKRLVRSRRKGGEKREEEKRSGRIYGRLKKRVPRQTVFEEAF